MSSFDRTIQPRIELARELLGEKAESEWQAGYAMTTLDAIEFAFNTILTSPV
jgi:hypothetical protein